MAGPCSFYMHTLATYISYPSTHECVKNLVGKVACSNYNQNNNKEEYLTRLKKKKNIEKPLKLLSLYKNKSKVTRVLTPSSVYTHRMGMCIVHIYLY